MNVTVRDIECLKSVEPKQLQVYLKAHGWYEDRPFLDTAVCSAMRYIVDPPKSPLKRGTLIYCTLLQRKKL